MAVRTTSSTLNTPVPSTLKMNSLCMQKLLMSVPDSPKQHAYYVQSMQVACWVVEILEAREQVLFSHSEHEARSVHAGNSSKHACTGKQSSHWIAGC